MEDANKAVVSQNVIEFVTIANEFCNLVEQIFNTDKKEFIGRSVKILPLLYIKGMFLPELELISEDLIEKFVSEEEWETINNDVSNVLEDDNSYTEVFDPLEESEEAKEVYLSENFADIYQDIKDFSNLYHQGTIESMNDAIVECRNSFEQYWGQRTVNAIRVLHHLNYTI
jgi:Domain of unknown function (DUF5063)